MSKIWTHFGNEEQVKDMDPSQKGEIGRRYRLSLERKNKSNIWTLLRKEKHVKDIDSPRKGRTSRRYEPSSNKGITG